MISTNRKKNSWKGTTHIRQISKKKNSKLPDFDDKFQQVAKECRRIWLNYFLDDCHFNYITKSFKKNLDCDFVTSSKFCPASCFLATARDALNLGATQKKPCS
jgi:hypothetical protein